MTLDKLPEGHLVTHEPDRAFEGWNDTAVDLPCGISVVDLVAERAAEQPGSVAVRHGQDEVTYRDLDEAANRMAWRLRELGVGRDAVVAVCLPRSAELIVALLAVLRAGGANLPLDPDYPAQRLALMVSDARAAVVITVGDCPDVSADGRVLRVDDPEETRRIAALPATAPPHRIMDSQLAYVIYTSGSTGCPKGVMIPHRALLNYLLWAEKSYCEGKPGAAVLHSSIVADFGITTLWLPLITGGCVTCGDSIASGSWSDPASSGITSLSFAKVTPGQLTLLSDQGYEPTAVSKVIVGGEQLLFSALHSARSFLGSVDIINEYGPTEATVGCVVHFVSAAAVGAEGPVAIGRPIANTRVYVLDSMRRPVPAGTPGELFIGGAGVARGYLGRPDLTAERFVPDAFGTVGGRLYRTGDVVRWRTDGQLEYIGRLDQQVKIRGYRVEPTEIEVTLRLHPRVRDAVVIVREDFPGDRRLAAYVTVIADEPGISGAEIRGWLRTVLPEHMVPTAVMVLDSFPLSPNGKIDRSTLPVPGWRPRIPVS